MPSASQDPWPLRLGALAMIAFGAPLLGAELREYVGVHPRAIAYAAVATILAVMAFGSYRGGFASRVAGTVHTCLVLFALAVALTLPYDANLLRLDSEISLESYPGYKFTRLLLLTGPTVAAAIAVYPLARMAAFRRGVQIGAFALGAIGIVELLVYQDLLSSGAHADWSLFADEAAFSTISMSMVFLFALVAVQSWAADRQDRVAIAVAILVSAAAMFASFLLAQRTTMALGLLFSFITLLAVVRRRAFVRLLWLGIAAAIALGGLGMISDGGPGMLAQYSTQLTRVESLLSGGDTSTAMRVDMWRFCAVGFVQEPLGHGFGSFGAHFREHFWPHNALAEAAFELGMLGFAAIAALVVQSVTVLWRLLTGGHRLYFFALVAALMWVMKAGDFASLGNWIFWLYLGIGALLRRPVKVLAAPPRTHHMPS